MSAYGNAIITAIIGGLILIGCSGSGSDPVSPGNSLSPTEIAQTGSNTVPSDHFLWGIWEIGFDEGTNRIVVTPDREISVHYDVTANILPPKCDDCFMVKLNSFDPGEHILNVDVILRNPFQQTGYDVRGIIFTDGSDLDLMNESNWTGLWDIPGGDELNGFRAFAKDETNRSFAPGAQHTENYIIYYPDFVPVKFAVDASAPSNCEEPYEISDITQTWIYDEVGSAGTFRCKVLDWQNDVDKVVLVAPEITGVELTEIPKYYAHYFRVDLTNSTGAPAGKYRSRLYATSSNSGTLALYQYVDIVISHQPPPINPVDITPPRLNFSPYDVFVEGNYAYVACFANGLHIFDISDSAQPIWVNSVPIPTYAEHVVVRHGKAFVVSNGPYATYIIDVDPPESAFIEQSFDVGGFISLQGDFVYVRGTGGLTLNVADPDNIEVISSSPNSGTWGCALETTENFMYDSYGWFDMGSDTSKYAMSISDISDPYNITGVGSGPFSYDIFCNEGYAYLSKGNKIDIYTILSDGKLSLHSTWELPFINVHSFNDLEFSGNYAYFTSEGSYVEDEAGLYVCELNPAPELQQVGSTLLYGIPMGVCISGEWAYVANSEIGLQVVDISVPDSPVISGSCESMGSVEEVAAGSDFVYAACHDRFRIVDVSEPEAVSIASNLEIPGDGLHVAVDGNYAYVTVEGVEDLSDHLLIIDISNPYAPEIVNEIDLGAIGVAYANGAIDTDNGYVYMTQAYPFGVVHILDVYPPETAYPVSYIEVPNALDCMVDGDYIYVVGDGLWIYDISDPETPVFVKSVEYTPKVLASIDLADGYAFTGRETNLVVFDVDPPEQSHMVIDVPLKLLGDYFSGLSVSGNRCFVSMPGDGIAVMDITNPEYPVPFQLIQTAGWPHGVETEGDYLYISSYWLNGLQIFRLY